MFLFYRTLFGKIDNSEINCDEKNLTFKCLIVASPVLQTAFILKLNYWRTPSSIKYDNIILECREMGPLNNGLGKGSTKPKNLKTELVLFVLRLC